jgi:MFS family permease
MQPTTGAAVGALPADAVIDADGRPTMALPATHLIRLSAYWLGLTAIDAAVNLFVQNRVNYGGFVQDLEVGRAQAVIGVGAAIVGIAIQPTVGAISDYTVTKWGRRKPYIVFGSLLDVAFLVAIATSNSVLAMAFWIMLLSVSTNIARGPFQGYVPDLVPSRQVGTASALVGLMQILGNVVGYGLVPLSIAIGNLQISLIAVAVIELVTMLSVVYRVGPGQPPRPKEGRSWATIAGEAWSTDILQERSYIWLLGSRLFFLMGGGVLFNLVVTYLKQTHGLTQDAAAGIQFELLAIVVVANVIVVVPASRLSDRIGRKPVIYASCLLGAAGIGLAAIAPDTTLALIGGALYGVSAGMFLSVDWALMTDIIPKAAAGRYMGLSNVATGASGLLAVAIGGVVIDMVNGAAGVGVGPRVAFLVGMAFYLLGALLLRPVDPRRRDDRLREAADPASA